jgi:hypothetical protein
VDDERIKLVLDLAQSSRDATEFRQKLEQLDATARKTGEGFDEVEKGTAKASKGTADFGRSALETGRIVQDFAQGGLGGIINNLEGFTQAVGLGPGAAGALTLLGVAALTATPYVKAWWHEFFDGANKVPATADALKRLNEELEANKKRLGELKDQQVLTNAELVEFNTLTAESIRLEKEANAAKEAAAARNAKTDDQAKLGGAVTKLTNGAGFDRFVNAAGGLGDFRGQKAEYDAITARLRDEKRPPTADEAARLSGLAGQINAFDLGGAFNADALQRRNEDLVNRARQGDFGAFDELLKKTTGDARDQLAAIDPRQAAARDLAQQRAKGQIGDAIGGAINPLITDLKANNAARQQGIDQAKAIDQQQDAAQKETEKVLDKQAKDKEKADKKAAEDRDKALRLNDAGIDSDAPTAEEVQAAAARGEFGVPRQTYRPMSHEERIAANRRRKARGAARGGGGLRSVAPTAPDDGGGDDGAEAQQALGGAMQNVQAVAAGVNAWRPAFQQLAGAIQRLADQVQGRGFNPYAANRSSLMAGSEGNW